MSNTNTVRYKQTTRQARIQTREGEFSNGMFFTDKPLAAGYSKLLVNYDINPVDGTLSPRRGFQSKAISEHYAPYRNPYIDWLNINGEAPFIADSCVQTTPTFFGEGTPVINTIACAPDTNSVYLIQQNLPNPITLVDSGKCSNKDGSKQFLNTLYEIGTLSSGIEGSRANYKKDYYQMILKTIKNPSIHQQQCREFASDYFFKKPIGTFAFGDRYFFFSHTEYTLKDPMAIVTSEAVETEEGMVTVKPLELLDANENILEDAWLEYDEETGFLHPYIKGSTIMPLATIVNPVYRDWVYIRVNSYIPAYSTADNTAKIVSTLVPISKLGTPLKDILEAHYLTLEGKCLNLNYRYPVEQRNAAAAGECVLYKLSFEIGTGSGNSGGSGGSGGTTTLNYAVVKNYEVVVYRKLKGLGYKIQLLDNGVDSIDRSGLYIEPAELHYMKSTPDPSKEDYTEACAHANTPNISNVLTDFAVIPQEQNPSEAASAGYNMLHSDPYNFVCETGANIAILGVLPYDTSGEIILTPVINKEIIFKCFYRAPSSSIPYRVKWEWREVGSAIWNTIKDTTGVQFSSLQPLTCPFHSAVEQLILRVTISDPSNVTTQVDGTQIEYVESTVSIGLNFNTTLTSSRQKMHPVHYDLGTAQGMLEWKSRLVLWGVEDAETVLFTSDVNNPTFFPYPNNIDVFDEPVQHCMVYGDDLLVFTSTKLYRLTFDETGITWTKSLIQKDLQIVPQDIPMFCRVKNMIFFKSGNYYYMLVPKSSSIVGETTIAPISNTMKTFFDNFPTEVQKIFKTVSQNLKRQFGDKTKNITDFLCNYNSYVDNQNVILNFVYDIRQYCYDTPRNTGSTLRYWTLSLIYDTENYTWKIYTYVSPRILKPVQINALSQNMFAYIIPYDAYTEQTQPCVVFSEKDTQLIQDNLITWVKDTNDQYDEDPLALGICYDYTTTMNTSTALTELKNYQYLDTGYRVLTSSVDLKKRFREVQFSINNVSQKALTFYTSFILDGQLRRDMQGYNTKVIVDPNDPRTGILLVERPYIDPKYLPSVPEFTVSVKDYINPNVTPGDTTLDDTFVLDNTKFPDLAYWKVRVSVSGKGYTPRLQILSLNDLDYNILSTNWVYRTMNSR